MAKQQVVKKTGKKRVKKNVGHGQAHHFLAVSGEV